MKNKNTMYYCTDNYWFTETNCPWDTVKIISKKAHQLPMYVQTISKHEGTGTKII